jgi:hypothetical protein
LDDLPSIFIGHENITDEKVKIIFSYLLKGLFPILGLFTAMEVKRWGKLVDNLYIFYLIIRQ